MAGFARYTQNYNTRLKDTPFYRKGARGADPLKSFVAKSHVNYTQNASRIRDMRFARSNELDKDYALRSKREDMISTTYANEKDPVKLAGLHGRMRMKLSRTGGALSDGMPQVVKLKPNHYGRGVPKGGTNKKGNEKNNNDVSGRFTSTSTDHVAPAASKKSDKHFSPAQTSELKAVANFIQKKGGGKFSKLRKRLDLDAGGAVDPKDLISNVLRSSEQSPMQGGKSGSGNSIMSPSNLFF
jgi:hypothetical protein